MAAAKLQHLACVLSACALLAGCEDHLSPVGPGLPQRSASNGQAPVRPDFVSGSAALGTTPGFSAALRTAMAETVQETLMQADIRPDAAVGALQEFFQAIDAQQAGGTVMSVSTP